MSYLVILLALLGLTLAPSNLEAANCGGATPCACGDNVIADTTLTAPLTCPRGVSGLTLQGTDNVTLDCNAQSITGPGWRVGDADAYGVYVRDGITINIGVIPTRNKIKNCTIVGFKVGIRLRTGGGGPLLGNEIRNNIIHDNGDPVTHQYYGIETSGGGAAGASPTWTTFDGNTVYSNADEGVHIGNGADNSTVTNNVIYGNFRENLYILDADSVIISQNYLGAQTSGASEPANNAVYMKNSVGWTVTQNTFAYRPLHITGSTSGNTYSDNTYLQGAFVKVDYYPGTPNLVPANNTFLRENIVGNGTAYCAYASGTSGLKFVDSSFSNCGDPSLKVDDGPGTPNSIATDVTFIGADPTVGKTVETSGDIRVQIGWKLDVTVTDGTNAIPGARIVAKYQDGSPLFDVTTDALGKIPQQEVIAKTSVAGVKRTPYTLNTFASGYITGNTVIDMTANQAITIPLTKLQ